MTDYGASADAGVLSGVKQAGDAANMTGNDPRKKLDDVATTSRPGPTLWAAWSPPTRPRRTKPVPRTSDKL